MPNSGLNDRERKIRSKVPIFKELTVQQKSRPVSHLGNMDRIALAECRRNVREECLGLPGRVHIFLEEREKGKEEYVRQRRKGGSILAWARACVCRDVFFFPFPGD